MNTKELIEKKLIWKIDENIWGKNCPKCNKIIKYKGLRSLECVSFSYKKNRLCYFCAQTGKKISEETRRRSSESHKGYKHTKEQTRKISEANRRKIRTPEMKLKYSLSKLGNKNPQYGKPTWNKGIEWSDKMKHRLSDAHKNQLHGPHSEETKQKIRVALLKRIDKLGIPICIDKNAPKFFDELNKKGYNFQPKRFFDIGYDADGYD